jgi:hypothetical protein
MAKIKNLKMKLLLVNFSNLITKKLLNIIHMLVNMIYLKNL